MKCRYRPCFKVHPTPGNRIESLDALRGIAVIIYLVSALVVPALNQLPQSQFISAAITLFVPPLWHGVSLRVFALPLFLFVAGASIVPAYNKRRAFARMPERRGVTGRILRRVLLLLAIGLICEGDLFERWPHVRLVGAFQRIAVCYAIAALLHLTTGWRFQAALFAFLLVDYWAILDFGASSSDSAAAYSVEANAAAPVDSALLPGRKYFGTWDPDGIVTTIPAMAITLSGLLAGKILAVGSCCESRMLKKASLWLALSGMSTLVAGLLAGFACPINAYLWTPPFCLIAIGVALVLLGILHGLRNGSARFLTAPGANALLVTVIAALAAQAFPTRVNLGGMIVTLYLVGVLAIWLDRRGVYISV